MSDKDTNAVSNSDKPNTETTDEISQNDDKRAHLWKKGQSGNPKGRPKGSRNKITKRYLKRLNEHSKEHLEGVLNELVKKHPKAYAKLIADLIPKEVDLDPQGNGDVKVMIVKSFDAVPEAQEKSE